MIHPTLSTKNLDLIPQSPQHLRALIRGVEDYTKAFGLPPAEGLRDFFAANSEDISQAWLAQLEQATEPDPWTFGFAMVHREKREVVGTCSFKGPPGTDETVEIAYGVAPGWQGRGLATEAAHALVEFARGTGLVRTVIAHTLPEPNASNRVLSKCGFQRIGEVIDPEDGHVWRWERPIESRKEYGIGQ